MKKSNDFFWPSYVDLMTGLFTIMLVLFVLSFKMLSDEKKATQTQLDRITEIQRGVKNLDSRFFIYQARYKRFSLIKEVNFGRDSSNIPPSDYTYLMELGNSIKGMITQLSDQFGSSVKYMLIIEGMASKDDNPNYFKQRYNKELSYRRALSIKEFWEHNNINIDPSICEVQVAGSGWEGLGRDENDEVKNQRILIQIIPKIGNL